MKLHPTAVSDHDTMIRQHEKMLIEKKREIKRQIRLAYAQGRTVPYSLSTLIESGVSVQVIRKVYRNESA